MLRPYVFSGCPIGFPKKTEPGAIVALRVGEIG